MQLARFTLDLLRPVPMQPLAAAVRIVRDGKRSQVLEASLISDGVEVARASALRTLLSPNTEPWCTESDAHPVWAPVEWQPETLARSALPGGLEEAVDLRFTGPGQYPCWLYEWLSVDGRGWLSHVGMSQLQGLITDIRGPVATVSMARLIFPRG